MSDDLYVRARIALAVAARETADLGRGVVGDVSTPMRRGERIRAARRIRLLSLAVLDRAVLAELSEGATWAEVGDAVGGLDAEEARRRYESTWREWLDPDQVSGDFGDFTVGLRGDPDLEGTAWELDRWWVRHAEPWETLDLDTPPTPVGQVLVDGQPATDDG